MLNQIPFGLGMYAPTVLQSSPPQVSYVTNTLKNIFVDDHNLNIIVRLT